MLPFKFNDDFVENLRGLVAVAVVADKISRSPQHTMPRAQLSCRRRHPLPQLVIEINHVNQRAMRARNQRAIRDAIAIQRPRNQPQATPPAR